jgi:hypothetical protein
MIPAPSRTAETKYNTTLICGKQWKDARIGFGTGLANRRFSRQAGSFKFIFAAIMANHSGKNQTIGREVARSL